MHNVIPLFDTIHKLHVLTSRRSNEVDPMQFIEKARRAAA